MKKFFLSGALALTASTAMADVMVDGSNAKLIMTIIQDEGYSISMDQEDNGNPVLVGKLDGSEYRVYFYGCDSGNGCDSIQFSTGYNLNDGMTLESVNEWNRGKRFAKVYLDDDMDPWMEMDINLDGGVTRRNMQDTMDYWRLLMNAFEDHIGW